MPLRRWDGIQLLTPRRRLLESFVSSLKVASRWIFAPREIPAGQARVVFVGVTPKMKLFMFLISLQPLADTVTCSPCLAFCELLRVSPEEEGASDKHVDQLILSRPSHLPSPSPFTLHHTPFKELTIISVLIVGLFLYNLFHCLTP